MKGGTPAEQRLQGMLQAAGLPVKASYHRAQVCAILGISRRTFFRYVTLHEIDPETGRPRHPWTLDSYKIRAHHRVRYQELVEYVARNRTFERQAEPDPRQMGLFGS